LLVFAGVLVAQQPPLPSGFYPIIRGESIAGPGLREVVIAQQRQFVELDAALSLNGIEIYAANNENSIFYAFVRYTRPACVRVVLQLDALSISSNGWGQDPDGCDVSFNLTPEQATRAANLFGTQRQDRREIGQHLQATFLVSDNRELVLRITNPQDGPAVQWRLGGRNRGPRDNQFSMRITRDGQLIPTIGASDLGGLSTMKLLRPGESAEVRAPISSWGDVSRPGRYVIEGAYETSLAPGGADTLGVDRRSRWDRRFTGTATFDFR
jgi:hypothetical protein